MDFVVRKARPGDGEAIARIHADMADHYAELAPERFRRPALDGYAAVIDAELAEAKATELELVAEIDGQVVASLYALLIAPVDGAEHAIPADLSTTRLRIEYLATAAEHRRTGAGTALVEAAEAWGRRARRDDRRDHDVPPQPALGPVLDGARGLRGALDQPP